MGYSLFDSAMNKNEGKLANSLLTVLKRDNCASFSRLIFFVNRGRFRLLNVEDDEKTLYYIDEEDEMITMSFPARLNLKGAYSRTEFSSFERNGEFVSFFLKKKKGKEEYNLKDLNFFLQGD